MLLKFLLLLSLLFVGCKHEGISKQCISTVNNENFNAAQVICEKAYNKALYSLGEEHPETVLTQIGLLTTYINLQEYDHAEPLALSLPKRSQTAFDKTYSSPSKENLRNRDEILANTYYSIAFIHEKQGKLSQSIDDWKRLYDWTKKFPESQFVSERFISSTAIADLCLDEKRIEESKYYLKVADDLYARYSDTKLLNEEDIKDYRDLKARSKNILEHNK